MTIDLLQLSKNLQTVIDEFSQKAELVDSFIDPVVQGTEVAELKVHLLLWVMMDHCKDVCEALTKMCNKNMPTIAERAERLMTNDMMDSINFMGKTFKPDVKDYVDVPAALKQACIGWLKMNPDSKHLVSEGYHPAAFTKHITEQFLEKGLREKLPPFINVFTKKTLNVRKVRGS